MSDIQSRKVTMMGKMRREYGWKRDGSMDDQGGGETAQGASRLIGYPSEVLARTMGKVVKKMIKK